MERQCSDSFLTCGAMGYDTPVNGTTSVQVLASPGAWLGSEVNCSLSTPMVATILFKGTLAPAPPSQAYMIDTNVQHAPTRLTDPMGSLSLVSTTASTHWFTEPSPAHWNMSLWWMDWGCIFEEDRKFTRVPDSSSSHCTSPPQGVATVGQLHAFCVAQGSSCLGYSTVWNSTGEHPHCTIPQRSFIVAEKPPDSDGTVYTTYQNRLKSVLFSNKLVFSQISITGF
jgi:hypothetical protein